MLRLRLLGLTLRRDAEAMAGTLINAHGSAERLSTSSENGSAAPPDHQEPRADAPAEEEIAFMDMLRSSRGSGTAGDEHAGAAESSSVATSGPDSSAAEWDEWESGPQLRATDASVPASSSSDGMQASGEAQSSQRLLHPHYGYAVLGGVNPEALPRGAAQPAEASPRLHPTRLFLPGQLYSAEDLNHLAPPSDMVAAARAAARAEAPLPSAAEVEAYIRQPWAVWMQQQFLTKAGRLMGRSQTKLPRLLHNRLMRLIRRNRRMALIPYEARHALPGVQLRAVANKALAANGSSGASEGQLRATLEAAAEEQLAADREAQAVLAKIAALDQERAAAAFRYLPATAASHQQVIEGSQ